MNRTANQIPILLKAIQVLEELGSEPETATSAALAKRLGVSGASCYRILQTFLARGWVRTLPGGGYALGAGLLPIARSVTGRDPLATWYPILTQFASSRGWTCKLSIRRANTAVTVYRVEGSRPYALAVRTGTAFPIAYGSSGAALLADATAAEVEALIATAPAECWRHQTPDHLRQRISEVAATGAVIDSGGFRPDIVSCSVPLRDATGRVEAAATALGFAADTGPGELAEVAAALVAALATQVGTR